MSKIDKCELESQIEYLKKKYGFSGLYHFTDFNNFIKIFSSGYLRSRWDCGEEGIEFHDGACRQIISSTNDFVKKCVRFYYKEKTPMLYDVEGIRLNNIDDMHIPIPVYLVFTEELIYSNYSIFSDGNARSENTTFGNNNEFFSTMDWSKIFHRGSLHGYDEYTKYEIIRKRHAELLCKRSVTTDEIKSIVFRCEADMKRAINLFGINTKFIVRKDFFNNQYNYIADYSIEKSTEKKELKLIFDFNNTSYSEYVVKVAVTDNFGRIVENEILNFDNYRGLSWTLTFDNYTTKWEKLDMYMNDILCIEEQLN